MRKQLNIGDVIVISHYISPDNVELAQHSFVVIHNQAGKIGGLEINLELELEFDLVATVMSSIKSKKHRDKIESYYPKNLIISFNDVQINNGNKKDGYIKANQLHYFQRDNISYVRIGKLSEVALDKLMCLIEQNEENGDLISNYNNIKSKETNNC